MLKDFSVQALFMGALAAFVGFASSLAVVLHGLQAMGATDAQAASGLMAKTAECIFTPLGMPSIGAASPSVSAASR